MHVAVSVNDGTGIRSYSIDVTSMKDGVALMDMVFDLLHESPGNFNVSSLDNKHAENGWIIQKIGDRFLFQLSVLSPMNDFEQGHGSIYSYKVDYDPEQIDWPSVEFGKIPRHCLLTKSEVVPLLAKLCRSKNPGQTAGFVYNAEDWDVVSGVE